MAGPSGEVTPTPQATPGADTSKALGDLENPVEGVAGGYSEEQAGLANDFVSPTATQVIQPAANQALPNTDTGGIG